MNVLYGPRMYYSLFGVRGLVTGARARLSPAPIIMAVAVPRLAHPVYLRARTTDVALCREIFLDGLYEAEFCEAPRVIVDAGANIGLSSVFYANEFPEARIIAIEPEASNYEMLLKNIAPYPGITPVHAALWKENGTLNLCDTGAGNTTFQVSDAGDPVRHWRRGAGARDDAEKNNGGLRSRAYRSVEDRRGRRGEGDIRTLERVDRPGGAYCRGVARLDSQRDQRERSARDDGISV